MKFQLDVQNAATGKPIVSPDSRKARRRMIQGKIRQAILEGSRKGVTPICPPRRCRLKRNGVIYRGPKAIGLVD